MSPIAAGRAPDAAELFARHLDLSPLRHRPRGVVKCIFHRDRTASLSVDLDRGVFHCFGCGEQGGVKRFAELVGERPPRARADFVDNAHDVPVALRDERRRQGRMTTWADLSATMRALHALERLVEAARTHATESVQAWEILADAAEVETFAAAETAALEGLGCSARNRMNVAATCPDQAAKATQTPDDFIVSDGGRP